MWQCINPKFYCRGIVLFWYNLNYNLNDFILFFSDFHLKLVIFDVVYNDDFILFFSDFHLKLVIFDVVYNDDFGSIFRLQVLVLKPKAEEFYF